MCQIPPQTNHKRRSTRQSVELAWLLQGVDWSQDRSHLGGSQELPCGPTTQTFEARASETGPTFRLTLRSKTPLRRRSANRSTRQEEENAELLLLLPLSSVMSPSRHQGYGVGILPPPLSLSGVSRHHRRSPQVSTVSAASRLAINESTPTTLQAEEVSNPHGSPWRSKEFMKGQPIEIRVTPTKVTWALPTTNFSRTTWRTS